MDGYFAGWPCSLAHNEHRGRYLVADEDLEKGRVVLVSEAYLSMILSSHKKRVCSFCHQDGRGRLSLCCGGCHQVCWCSPECRAAHAAAEPQATQYGCSIGLGAVAHGSENQPQEESLAASGGGAGLVEAKPGSMPNTPVGCGGSLAERMCLLEFESRGEASSSTSRTGDRGNYGSGSKHSNSDDECEGAQQGCTAPGFRVRANSSPGRSTSAAQLQDPWQRAPLSATAVPHGLVCGVLRQFGSVKWSADVESVLLGVLQLLALEHLEDKQAAQQDRPEEDGRQFSLQHPWSLAVPWHRAAGSFRQAEQPLQGSSEAAQQELQQTGPPGAVCQPSQAAASNPELPHLTHADFLMLQSHAADWDAADRRDWLKYAAQLITMLKKAGWPGQLPSPEVLLEYAGRITSNNFGIYAPPAASQEQQAQQSTEEVLGQGTEAGEQLGNQAGFVARQSGQASALVQQPAAAQRGATIIAAAGKSRPRQQVEGKSGPGQQLRQNQEQQSASKPGLIGRELYITASFFNHSCEPNCVVQRGFKTATVATQRAIKAGEELTISYMDIDLPRSARRNHLQKFFHFSCECSRCEREASEGSARCSYESSKVKPSAPKRRGRKARVSR